jgi:hypothetical protein
MTAHDALHRELRRFDDMHATFTPGSRSHTARATVRHIYIEQAQQIILRRSLAGLARALKGEKP